MKKLLIIILISFQMMLLTSCHENRSKEVNNDSSLEYEDVYQDVDLQLSELIKASDYQDGNHEYRKEVITDILNKMASDGTIFNNSVQISDDDSLITFEYRNGAYGGVMLKECEEGIDGINPNYVTDYNSDMTAKDTAEVIDWGNVTHPYVEESLNAVIMYGLGNNKILNVLRKNQVEWSDTGLKTELDEHCTLEDFRTKLSGKQLIIIREHGYYAYHNTPMILLDNIDVNVNILEAAALPIAALYNNDLADLYSKRIVSLIDAHGTRVFGLLPEFIEHY